MNILFVCTGNISRSYLAENLLNYEIEKRRINHVSVASAGLHVNPGNMADPQMIDYLNHLGIKPKDHTAREVTKADVDWADIILVMQKEHRDELNKMWPHAVQKVKLLSSFISANGDSDDIVDPFGGSVFHYRSAQSQITLAIRSILNSLL
jgi:protein-tyrosine-phosphatase